MGEWKQGEQCPQDIYDGTDFVVGVPDSIVAKRVCDKHNNDLAELAAAKERVAFLEKEFAPLLGLESLCEECIEKDTILAKLREEMPEHVDIFYSWDHDPLVRLAEAIYSHLYPPKETPDGPN